jgi:hypothetical protein
VKYLGLEILWFLLLCALAALVLGFMVWLVMKAS